MRFGFDGRVLSFVAALVLSGGVSVLSVGSAQAAGCANEQLRAEQPYGLELPDCRAYEMVSPLDKDDNNVLADAVRASVSGEAVTYESKGGFSEPLSAMYTDRYIARRGPNGWSTRNITPPYHTYTTSVATPFYELLFTPDLSKGIVKSEDTPLTSGSPAGYDNLYVADTSGASPYQLVSTVVPPLTEAQPYLANPIEPVPSGISDDLSRVVFQQEARLTPEALLRKGRNHVYEWANGQLSLIDIPPEGQTLEVEDFVGAPGIGNSAQPSDIWHAVSTDGLRVFFTGAEEVTEQEHREGKEGRQGQIYVREVDEEETVEVSASQRTNPDPLGPKPARYWDASADGSRMFFASRSELTNDANTGPADNTANLYEYDLETGVLRDLTVDTNPGDISGAGFLGLATASEDGSYVYFVAEGDLAEGAVSGKPNLYLHHAGNLTFIASLEPGTPRGVEGEEEGGDSLDWAGNEPQEYSLHIETLGPSEHRVRVSPDGTHFAFESERSLTGYDNEPAEPKDCEIKGVSRPCREIYVYDAGTHGLVCASCDPSGASPVGPARFGGHEEVQEGFAIPEPYYLPRNFSEDGGRFFFDSPDGLVAHDSNGQQDVYEYEEGQVFPVSDVAGNQASSFVDASPSGNDVFVTTADQLLPSDVDFRVDLYDVRVGGGMPVSVTPPACVNGDSCKGPVSPQPGVFGAPASATFSGAGNVPAVFAVKPAVKGKAKAKPKRCKKGSVRRRGRCVKSKAEKSRGHSKKGRK
jgi:hypothetical protein